MSMRATSDRLAPPQVAGCPISAAFCAADVGDHESRAFSELVQTVILLVSHPFRRKRGMDGARKSIAKEEMLYMRAAASPHDFADHIHSAAQHEEGEVIFSQLTPAAPPTTTPRGYIVCA
jgi:hypothetical protein